MEEEPWPIVWDQQAERGVVSAQMYGVESRVDPAEIFDEKVRVFSIATTILLRKGALMRSTQFKRIRPWEYDTEEGYDNATAYSEWEHNAGLVLALVIGANVAPDATFAEVLHVLVELRGVSYQSPCDMGLYTARVARAAEMRRAACRIDRAACEWRRGHFDNLQK